MSKRVLGLILISMLIMPCFLQTFAGETLHLEGEAIRGSDGVRIGFGLRWNPIAGVGEYTIWRYGKDGTREKFIVEEGETSYADTSIDLTVDYDYFITAGGLTSNTTNVEAANDDDIIAIAVPNTENGYNYISIRFSKDEPYITVSKPSFEKPERKPYYTDKAGKPEKITPIMYNNICFLPIRAILDELKDAGGNVYWDEASKTVTLNLADNTVTIKNLSAKEQSITFNNKSQQKWGELVRMRNDRLYFAVEVINLLAGKTVIIQNSEWNAFNLVYTF